MEGRDKEQEKKEKRKFGEKRGERENEQLVGVVRKMKDGGSEWKVKGEKE